MSKTKHKNVKKWEKRKAKVRLQYIKHSYITLTVDRPF